MLWMTTSCYSLKVLFNTPEEHFQRKTLSDIYKPLTIIMTGSLFILHDNEVNQVLTWNFYSKGKFQDSAFKKNLCIKFTVKD